jgi:hypothetical protein
MNQRLKIRENKRKATRFIRKDIKVSLIKTNLIRMQESINCKLIDLSSTGIQVSTPKKMGVKTLLNIVLQFDSGATFNIKGKVVWHKTNDIYKSNHSFSTIKRFLNKKNKSLETLTLFEEDRPILAKFRSLSSTHVKILSYSPLDKNKQHSLVFNLADKSTHSLNTNIEDCQHYQSNCYGIKFEKTNDPLGECLLETQTDLFFK